MSVPLGKVAAQVLPDHVQLRDREETHVRAVGADGWDYRKAEAVYRLALANKRKREMRVLRQRPLAVLAHLARLVTRKRPDKPVQIRVIEHLTLPHG